jgi:hypothetical protein
MPVCDSLQESGPRDHSIRWDGRPNYLVVTVLVVVANPGSDRDTGRPPAGPGLGVMMDLLPSSSGIRSAVAAPRLRPSRRRAGSDATHGRPY